MIIPVERLAQQIYVARGLKVMLDSDLAELYQVSTKRLNEAVKRNLNRFPEDFMFQLTPQEADSLRSQFTTSNLRFQIGTSTRGGRRYLPYVFTEHGVAMLSSIPNSDRAVQMNILMIRAFVKLRELLASNKDLADRLEKVEATQRRHTSVISLLAEEIDTLNELPPEPPRKRIGFVTDEDTEEE